MTVEFVLSMIYLTKTGLYCRRRLLFICFISEPNFLGFRSVITTIRWFLTMSNLNVAQCKLNVPFLPFTLIEVLRNKKGCRDMYYILVNKTVHSPAIQKWQNNILLPENFKRNNLIPHLRKCTKDTTLIWFEIRIMHRILATNSLLQKIGILLDNRMM